MLESEADLVLETEADLGLEPVTLEPEPITTWEPEPALAIVPEESWEDADEFEAVGGPAHAPRRKNADRKSRSRVFTLTAVLASLLMLLVAGAAIAHALYHSTTPAAAPPTHHVAAPTTSPGTSRLQTATDATDSATTAAQVALASLSNFPTPTNVGTIINPYISSLQLYETFLSGSDAPAPARAAVAHAETQVRQDLQFLGTIDGLPPLQLGSYLVQFDTDATQLQTTLSALEEDLRSSAS